MNDGASLIWLLAAPGFPLGWLVGRIAAGRLRRSALGVLLLLPPFAVALAAAAEPGELGVGGTIVFALFIFAGPVAVWMLLAVLGYLLGKANPFGLG